MLGYRPPGRATPSVSTLTEKNIVEYVSREHQAAPNGSVLKQPNAGAQLPAVAAHDLGPGAFGSRPGERHELLVAFMHQRRRREPS